MIPIVKRHFSSLVLVTFCILYSMGMPGSRIEASPILYRGNRVKSHASGRNSSRLSNFTREHRNFKGAKVPGKFNRLSKRGITEDTSEDDEARLFAFFLYPGQLIIFADGRRMVVLPSFPPNNEPYTPDYIYNQMITENEDTPLDAFGEYNVCGGQILAFPPHYGAVKGPVFTVTGTPCPPTPSNGM